MSIKPCHSTLKFISLYHNCTLALISLPFQSPVKRTSFPCIGNLWFVSAIGCNIKPLNFTNHIFSVNGKWHGIQNSTSSLHNSLHTWEFAGAVYFVELLMAPHMYSAQH